MLASVILAVRNGEEYLRQSIDSVLNQEYDDFEFLIIVNNSSDSSIDIALSYNDERIKVYETDIGQLSYNLNYGINKATGKYIVRLDADDIAHPCRIRNQLEFAEKNNIDVLGSFMCGIDSQGDATGKIFKNPISNSQIRESLWYKNPLSHPSIIIKRSILLEVGGYLGGRFGQDYDLWLRLSRNKNIKFWNLDIPLTNYRVHAGQSKGSRSSYAEVAGYLLREAIFTYKFKFILGAMFYVIKSFFLPSKK